MNTIYALPESVPLAELVKRIGKSDRQIMKYRLLAYKHVPDYRQSCLTRNPEYIRLLADHLKAKNSGKKTGRKPLPDPPDFTRREAEILEAISLLFDEEKTEFFVLIRIKADQYFYLDPRYISKKPQQSFNEQTTTILVA